MTPWLAEKRWGRCALQALLSLVAAASLWGQEPEAMQYKLSPDIDIALNGFTFGDTSIVVDDGNGAFSDGGALNLSTVKGLDESSFGLLVCFETVIDGGGEAWLPSLPILIGETLTDDFPNGLVLPDDQAPDLQVQSGQMSDARADAVTTMPAIGPLGPTGALVILLSWDISVKLENGTVVDDEDLWGPENNGLFFDGSAAGVDSALNLDAAHYLPGTDQLLLSFDGSGVVGGVAFDDEDVLRYDRLGQTWAMAYDASLKDVAWVPADLDALWVDVPFVQGPTPVLTSLSGVVEEQPEVAPKGWAVLRGMNIADEFGNTEVLVNGVPTQHITIFGLTVTVTSSSVVFFQIPEGTGVGTALFQVDVDQEASPSKVLSNQLLRPVSEFAPAIFESGAAYHLDQSAVSEQNPALPGETVLVTEITGLGAAESPELTVMVGELAAQVVSLEERMDLSGVYTLEMIVPEGLGPGSYPLKLTVGGASFTRPDFLIVGGENTTLTTGISGVLAGISGLALPFNQSGDDGKGAAYNRDQSVGGISAKVESLQEAAGDVETSDAYARGMIVPEGLGPGSRAVTPTAGESTVTSSGFPIVGGGGSELEITAVFEAAGFQPRISPGSVVSVFGNFVETTAKASSLPLETDLNGFSVAFNGIPGALFGVFDGDFDQFNVQVPWNVDVSSGKVQVKVHRKDETGEVWSNPFEVDAAGVSPGVYMYPPGTTQAVVANLKQSEEDDVIAGSWAQPSGQAAAIGAVVTIWCGGLGAVSPLPATGDIPQPPGTAPVTDNTVRVFVGGVEAHVLGAILQAENVGLNQINAVIPGGVAPGNAVPIVIEMEREDGSKVRSREDVTIAVRPAP